MLSTPATRRCLGGGKCECSVNLTGVTFRQVECRCHCLTCNAPDNVVPFAALVPGLQCPSSSSGNPAVLSNASQDPQQTTTAAGRRPSGCPFSGHAIARGGRPNAASERPPPAAASSPTPRSASSCCELVASTTPPSRYGHTLTEFFGGHFVLFGGRRAATQCLNDVWVLIPKLQLWVQLQDLQQVPSPRYGHSCHLHLVTNEDEGGNPQTQQRSLIFFGGSDGASTQYFDELQCLRFTASGISKTFHRIAGGIEAAGGSPNLNNNTNNNNSSVSNSSFASAGGAKTAPLGRRSHTLVPYKNGRAVLFGGYRGVSLDDVWFLEPTLQWTKAATTGAPYQFARYSHSAVVHDDSMYVFGGFGPNGVCSNHVWVLHLVTLAWRPLETFGCAPCGRFGHSASLVGHKMVLFGGVPSFPSNESLNDCHTLNVISKEWTQLCAQVDEAASSCCTDCHHHHRHGGERVGSAMALLESRDDGIRVDLRSTAEGMDASSDGPPLPPPTPQQQREEAFPVVVADGTSSRSLAWSDAGAHGFEGNDVNEEEIEEEIDASLLPSSSSQDGDAELLLASLPSDGARSPLPGSSSFPRERGTHEGPPSPPPPSVPPGGGSGMLPQSLSTTNLLPTTSSPNPQEAPHRALSRVGSSSSSSSRHTPIPRRSHTAVIDSSQRHAIVIFGGWNGGGDAALSTSSSSTTTTNNTVSGGIAAVPTESTMDGRCFHMILAPPTLKEMVRDQIIRQGGTVSTPPHHNDQPGLHRHEVLT